MQKNRLRGWLTLSALTGCAVTAANVTGCGGSGTTAISLSGDAGADGATDGSSGGGEDGNASSSSSGSSGGGDATTDDGGEDGGADAASSSSSGGSDAGDDTSSSSGGEGGSDASSSSGGDSGADGGSSSGAEGGSDASVDAGADAGSDGGNSCPDGAACSTGTGNGICSGGACTACNGGTTAAGVSAACTTAYGGSANPYVCLAGSCVPGNCTTSADCASPAGSPTCGFSTPNFCGGCSADSDCPSTDICVTAVFDAGAVQGTCVAKTAGGCPGATASACPANPSDECCGGSCSVGNCCVGLTPNGCNGAITTCAPETSGQTSGGGICTSCTAVSGAAPTYYVDPIHGSDTDGTGNVAASASCAFQTITRALQVIGATAPTNTTIDVVGGNVDAGVPVTVRGVTGTPTAGQERFPLTIGANITITNSSGPVTVEVPAAGTTTNTEGFILSGAKSGIAGGTSALTIDGQSHGATIGIVVTSGSASVSGVTVQSFEDEGILVTTSGAAAGALTIGASTTLTGNAGDGLLVTSGTATVTGVANKPITFSNNEAHGIRVSGSGIVTVTGDLGSTPPSTSDVVVTGNAVAGVWVQNTTATTRSTFTGVVSTGSTGGNGFRIIPGSSVRVRGSWVLGNTLSGIDVENTTGGNSTAIGNIDLGTGTGGDAGDNVVQSASGNQNGSAGICLRLPGLSVTGVTLNALGNLFRSTDCRSTAGTLVTSTGRACTGAADVGGNIAATSAAAGNKINVSMCTYQ
jgi:hypothetical protein